MSDSDKKNVLVWGHIHHAGPDLLKGRDDVSLEIVEDVTADIGDRLATLDGIIVRTQRIDAAVLERAPRLAVVARHGVGFDAVDVPALSQRGIPLTTVGEANAHTVAEHALFLMLTLAKQGLTYDAATRGDDWKLRETFSCTELWRKTVLVIGFGRIGSRVSRLCRAFGMDVLVIDPYVPAFRIESEGHRRIEDMAAALGRRIAHGGPAVLVGTDFPGLPPEIVLEAFDALARLEANSSGPPPARCAVLGPARDGGYYLIGLNRLESGIFSGLEWGGGRVFEAQSRILAEKGYRIHTLPEWRDVDTPGDLKALRARLAESPPETAPNTRAALESLVGSPAGQVQPPDTLSG